MLLKILSSNGFSSPLSLLLTRNWKKKDENKDKRKKKNNTWRWQRNGFKHASYLNLDATTIKKNTRNDWTYGTKNPSQHILCPITPAEKSDLWKINSWFSSSPLHSIWESLLWFWIIMQFPKLKLVRFKLCVTELYVNCV